MKVSYLLHNYRRVAMPYSLFRMLISKPRNARRNQLRRYRPRIESLEDRTVLSFFTAPTYPIGLSPHGEAVGDFNGDGHADLVVVNQGANTISVLLGNGDGTFKPKTDYATGTSPAGVAVGDLNGDGHLDIAVANASAASVSVLLGNGDGTFGPKTDFLLPLIPDAVAVGDFNGDGKADLVIAAHNGTSDSVMMMLGNGNGTFQAPIATVTDTNTTGFTLNGGAASSIRAADVNGDGQLDVVVVNNKDVREPFGRGSSIVVQETGSMSVLLGNGNGTLQPPRNFAAGLGAQSVVVGDFNGDGRPDIAVNNFDQTGVSIYTNSGGGTFTSSTLSLGAGNVSFSPLAVGDFNGDGIADLAVSTFAVFAPGGVNGVKLFYGQVGGPLQAGPIYLQNLGYPVVADLNGDGHLDLVGTNGVFSSANAVEPWLNNGNGTFPAPSLISSAGITFASQATADFNGDGIPDIVTSTGQVQLGLGDGRFGDTTTLAAFPAGSGVTVAAVDADGNGTIDVMASAAGYPTGQAPVWYNSPGYDNRTGGAVAFTISAPTQIAAGDNTSVTVTAVDALGNPVPGFLGTVDVDFTPAGSTVFNLASQYTFTVADNGRHTILFSNLTQASAGTLSVFAVGMPTATQPLTIVPSALNKFAFSAPATIPAGTPFSFAITAEDRFGNVETGYTGTVHFSALANDTQAVLPVDYTFTAADAGTHAFGATLFKTAGTSSPFINAKDLASGVNTSQAISVTPLAPASLSMSSLPNPYTAGSVAGVRVTVVDIYGNQASGYTGTVHFSSTDAKASLPADYTFTTADGGAHNFLVTLETAGTQSVGVADSVNPSFASSRSGIVVNPAPASLFVFTGMPASTTAGSPLTFTVTALDPFGNRANYSGEVFLSSSDSQADLSSFGFFSIADAGSHTFTATLKTAGPQTITVSDASTGTPPGTPTGTQATTVTPASAASYSVTGFPTTTTAGVAHAFTVAARDAFGNVATGYTGTATFTSSDPIASVPANYTFTAADAGMHSFSATLKRAGSQFIEAIDTLASSFIGAESGIVVTPAAVSQFAFSGPTSVTKGVGFKITVTAEDAFGNLNAGYRGSVHLASTDPTGGTQNFTFSNNDNGVHIFSYTFNALGFQTITVTDTSNSSITGSFTVDVLAQTGGGGGGGIAIISPIGLRHNVTALDIGTSTGMPGFTIDVVTTV
jgi:hypothetical protein